MKSYPSDLITFGSNVAGEVNLTTSRWGRDRQDADDFSVLWGHGHELNGNTDASAFAIYHI